MKSDIIHNNIENLGVKIHRNELCMASEIQDTLRNCTSTMDPKISRTASGCVFLEPRLNTSLLLTRAREWGAELRALEGGGAESAPPANSAPMKARITKCLWEVDWLKISIMCNFGDPRSISSG